MAVKTFVLDANVLLHDPKAITNFHNNQVVIPLTVIEELEKMKRLPNELGKNSRAIFRFLDDLVQNGTGNLHEGIKLPKGGTVRVELQLKKGYDGDFSLTVNDNKILMAAYRLHENGEKVIFVSKDIAARIKAEAIGLEAQDYENLKVSYDVLYSGVKRLGTTKSNIDHFYKDGKVKIKGLDCFPNEYCILTSKENSSAIGKYSIKTDQIESLLKVPDLWGIEPRNAEQRCAVDALLRDDIKLVTLIGPAGTGKTLLALACGLRKVFDESVYHKILVSRPIVPLGRDIGYLPGTKEEKLFHWMQPIYDNLEFLCSSPKQRANDENETLRWVMDSKKIEMEAVTYIRGRSLPRVFMIVDEAQNLTPHEVKTIISRAGEGTKVILTGDPTQIDNPYLDKDSNGLTYIVGKLAQHPVYGHIFLEKTERSPLAALAAEVL
ncbi:MAG: PhoH family protein [Waddliaceae bacterium]